MYDGSTDGELLVLSREDPDAFGEFYERHAEDVLRYFARHTLDPNAAAELTAETFAEAFASRARYRDRGTAGAAWLFGIARHQLSHYYRKGAVEAAARNKLGMRQLQVSAQDYERIEELIDFERVGRAIAAAMSTLSEEQREAMILRVVEGRPYEEVARLLSCSEQTARARVSRGLRRLGKLLETEPGLEIGRQA